jgi:hypothetical protein
MDPKKYMSRTQCNAYRKGLRPTPALYQGINWYVVGVMLALCAVLPLLGF